MRRYFLAAVLFATVGVANAAVQLLPLPHADIPATTVTPSLQLPHPAVPLDQQNLQSTIHFYQDWQNSIGNGFSDNDYRIEMAADAGNVFIANENGVVSAVNATTGQLLWQVQLKQSIASGVAVGEGKLFVTTQDAHCVALMQSNGQVSWVVPIDNITSAPPAYADGTVVIKFNGSGVSALAASTGALLWHVAYQANTVGLAIAGAAKVIGNSVYAGFSDGTYLRANLQSGQVMWQQQAQQGLQLTQLLNNDFATTPAYATHRVFLAGYDGTLVAASSYTGHMLWQQPLSTYSGVIADSRYVIVTDTNGFVRAYNARNGKVAWQELLSNNATLTAPVFAGPYVLVADQSGKLYLLDEKDGSIVALYSLQAGIYMPPLIVQNTILVYDADGNLTSLHLGQES